MSENGDQREIRRNEAENSTGQSVPVEQRDENWRDNQDPYNEGFFAADLNVRTQSNEDLLRNGDAFPAEGNSEQRVIPDMSSDDYQENEPSTSSVGRKASSNSVHHAGGPSFLPDILGEEPQTVCREDLHEKIRKVDGLIRTAEDIQKKYAAVEDPAGENNVGGMLLKLLTQKRTLEMELKDAMESRLRHQNANSGQGNQNQPPQTQLKSFLGGNAIMPKPSAALKVAREENVPESNLSSQQTKDLAHSVSDLRQNLRDVLQRKSELEAMVEVLGNKRRNCNAEEKATFTDLLDRHETRIAELNHTVVEAQKTLMAMESLQEKFRSVKPEGSTREVNRLKSDEILSGPEEDEDDGEPPDESAMLVLRSRLSKLRGQSQTLGWEEADLRDKREKQMKAQQQKLPVEEPRWTGFRTSADPSGRPELVHGFAVPPRDLSQFAMTSAPAPARESRLTEDFEALATRHGMMQQNSSLMQQPGRSREKLPVTRGQQQHQQQMQQQRQQDFETYFDHLSQQNGHGYASHMYLHELQEMNNRGAMTSGGRNPSGNEMEEPQNHHSQGSGSLRSYRSTDGRCGSHNELYGLSSKSGDDYYIIDNIHNMSSSKPDEQQFSFPYSRFSQAQSSDSDEEDFTIRNDIQPVAESSKRYVVPAFEKRNDLSGLKKNSNSTNSNKGNDSGSSSRFHGLSMNSPQVNRDRQRGDYFGTSYENEHMGSVVANPFRDMPVPEVVASLQIIMAEQQKILSSCAHYVSKPSSSPGDSSGRPLPHPDQPRNDGGRYDRSDRQIPMINNSLHLQQPGFSDSRKSSTCTNLRAQEAPSGQLNNQRFENSEFRDLAPSPRPLRDQPGEYNEPGNRYGSLVHLEQGRDRRDPRSLQKSASDANKKRKLERLSALERSRNVQSFTEHLVLDQGTQADSSRVAPLENVMRGLLKDYANDLGALHYMLDCIASLKSSTSRAAVAAQLGLLVSAERNKGYHQEIQHQDETTRRSLEPVAKPHFGFAASQAWSKRSAWPGPPDLVGQANSSSSTLVDDSQKMRQGGRITGFSTLRLPTVHVGNKKNGPKTEGSSATVERSAAEGQVRNSSRTPRTCERPSDPRGGQSQRGSEAENNLPNHFVVAADLVREMNAHQLDDRGDLQGDDGREDTSGSNGSNAESYDFISSEQTKRHLRDL